MRGFMLVLLFFSALSWRSMTTAAEAVQRQWRNSHPSAFLPPSAMRPTQHDRGASKRPTCVGVSGNRDLLVVPGERERQSRIFFNPIWSPYVVRPTVRKQVDRDVWIFEQELGLLNVTEVIRMTAIRLQEGGLFIYAPIAPTKECIRLIDELNEEVKYVVLPVTAVEHKLFTKPFVNHFTQAKVYIAPGQFSFPLPLPLGFRVNAELPSSRGPRDARLPFENEIEFETFSFNTPIGNSVEVACYHKRSNTLLTTDSLQFVDAKKRTPEQIWTALQVFFILAPRNETNSGFFYNVPEGFNGVLNRHYVPPQLRKWVFELSPVAARAWVDRVSRWPFRRHISCHFDSPTRLNPSQFRAAFSFLDDPSPLSPSAPFPEGRAPFIESVERFLKQTVFKGRLT